jgi:hypothetical protein
LLCIDFGLLPISSPHLIGVVELVLFLPGKSLDGCRLYARKFEMLQEMANLFLLQDHIEEEYIVKHYKVTLLLIP